ncbi:MAG: monovalent cation/H+ antiporter complex subunit F [Candidatus Cloacimonadota bacterium]|nr:monovalent cation/H+ antiporter complex subunit F [Candidatus Cloacimonadota bacterium]
MANIIYNIAAIIALLGIVLTFIRLILGPTIADRAVALDGMTIISISLIVFIAYFSHRIIYLDVAIVYGLISFIGIVAIARYLERGI